MEKQNNLTIEDLKKAKRNTEELILSALSTLEDVYGVNVTDIRYEKKIMYRGDFTSHEKGMVEIDIMIK